MERNGKKVLLDGFNGSVIGSAGQNTWLPLLLLRVSVGLNIAHVGGRQSNIVHILGTYMCEPSIVKVDSCTKNLQALVK